MSQHLPFLPAKKKSHRDFSSILLGVGAIVFMISALVMVTLALSEEQDLRQQAASCTENPVNVEFRLAQSIEKSWNAGTNFKPKVGDKIDVNCFSRNGTALLNHGQLDGFLNGDQILKDRPTEIRSFTLTKNGSYKFVCSNGAGCYDADSFVVGNGQTTQFGQDDVAEAVENVIDTAQQNTIGPGDVQKTTDTQNQAAQNEVAEEVNRQSVKLSNQTGCNQKLLSDLNGDCQVDVSDYTVFLEDFRKHVAP